MSPYGDARFLLHRKSSRVQANPQNKNTYTHYSPMHTPRINTKSDGGGGKEGMAFISFGHFCFSIKSVISGNMEDFA